MSRFSVSMLDEAVEDLLIGKQFYEGNEEGVGAYFAASALADITSLGIYAGIHSVHFGYFRLLMKRFPFAVYYRKELDLVEVMQFLICGGTPRPFARYWPIGRANRVARAITDPRPHTTPDSLCSLPFGGTLSRVVAIQS